MTNSDTRTNAPSTRDATVSPAWRALAATALTITISGILNAGTAWLPPQFNNTQWRFLITGATIDGFTVVTISMFALAASLIAMRSGWLLKVFAGTSAAFALVIALLYVVFLRTLPRIHRLVESLSEADTVSDGIVRASVWTVTMVLLLGGLSFVTWRLAARPSEART